MSASLEPDASSIPAGDLGVLLKVAARLAASESYEALSSHKIAEAAGVPRRTFETTFSSLEDCFCSVLETRWRDVVPRVERACERGVTPESGVCLAMAALSDSVGNDASFARLCFDDSVAPGVEKARCHQAIADDLVHLIHKRLNGLGPVSSVRIEASVWAAWGAIQNQVTMGRSHEVAQKAPMFAYLLLAPVIGAPAASRATQKEFASTR